MVDIRVANPTSVLLVLLCIPLPRCVDAGSGDVCGNGGGVGCVVTVGVVVDVVLVVYACPGVGGMYGVAMAICAPGWCAIVGRCNADDADCLETGVSDGFVCECRQNCECGELCAPGCSVCG